jgi:hypothetical protein
MARVPYGKLTDVERAEMIDELLTGWSEDWADELGKRPDGAIIWQVNAADVMLLVNEIKRQRLDDV